MDKKRLFPLILIAGIGLAVFYFYHKYRIVPDVDLKTLEVANEKEEPFDMNSLKGKKLIVSFYASWCGNCLEELRDLNKVKNTELADIEVICLTDEPLEKLLSFKERTGYPFTFLKLKKQFPELGINSIPVTYIVNRDLEVIEEHLGYLDWTDASTLNHIKSLF
jgi:peroxiredoxin